MSNLFKGMDLSWKAHLGCEFEKDYMQDIKSFLVNSSKNNELIYPNSRNIFKALELTSFSNLKVVILGQDPYHGPSQAHGLAFSVQEDNPIPPSLKNIFMEISSDLKAHTRLSGDLTSWAKQGVLLLNTCLTVSPGKPGSHSNLGWQRFTDAIIKAANSKENIVFMLWGSYAQKKKDLLSNKNNLVLEAPHPSPLSAHRGFFGCRHFSQANSFLRKHSLQDIDWIS